MRHNILQCITIHYNTLQCKLQHNTIHCTIQYIAQYNTIQYNTFHNTIQYNTIQYIAQYNTIPIQYNTLHNTIQYNTIQCNTIVHLITQNDIIQHKSKSIKTALYLPQLGTHMIFHVFPILANVAYKMSASSLCGSTR
jgi:hypothetical protein